MLKFLRFLTIEPVSLSLKEKGIAALACFFAILLTGLLTHAYAGDQATILIASMGASAVILFVIPGSPMAQPWPFVGGQLVSALVGVTCAYYIPDLVTSAAVAVGLAVLIMIALRCLHPPGAATTLTAVFSGVHKPLPDYEFLLVPVGVNVLWMLVLALIINRLVLRRDYPAQLSPSKTTIHHHSSANTLAGISLTDVEQVTRDFQHFLDIGAEELLLLFNRLQLLACQKNIGALTCAEIMQSDIVTAEYATEVEDAWRMMHEQRLKVLPVLDVTKRVIGIVTQYDFLKNLKLTPYRSFQDKWLTFIKNTHSTHTSKPEAIGHIMTRHVKTLPSTAHIAELVPLIVIEGHHHVPIVDADGRFVGLVFQSQLLSALFKAQSATQTLQQHQTLPDSSS